MYIVRCWCLLLGLAVSVTLTDGSDLMPMPRPFFSFCNDDDDQQDVARAAALHWGRRDRRDLWRVWARYRMLVRVTWPSQPVSPQPVDAAHHWPASSVERPLNPPDSCRQVDHPALGPRASQAPSGTVHPCALMDPQVAAPVGMYDEGSWLAWLGSSIWWACLFQLGFPLTTVRRATEPKGEEGGSVQDC
ncbi:hypothetical protein F5Y10DRAFT_150330 [Nemania abortiva]|nr:hypothetical protein F5Y10DRAFT_150330 [Nemania abortiva]